MFWIVSDAVEEIGNASSTRGLAPEFLVMPVLNRITVKSQVLRNDEPWSYEKTLINHRQLPESNNAPKIRRRSSCSSFGLILSKDSTH